MADVTANLDNWLKVLTGYNELTKKELDDLASSTVGIKELMNKMDTFVDSEEERIAQMARDAYWMDIRQEQEIELLNAEKRGLAKGEEIGLAKGEEIGLAKGEEIGLAKGREEERKQGVECIKRIIGLALKDRFGVTIGSISPYLEGKSREELESIGNRLYDYSTFEEFRATL